VDSWFEERLAQVVVDGAVSAAGGPPAPPLTRGASQADDDDLAPGVVGTRLGEETNHGAQTHATP
jgi:hypothetical protein